MNRIDHLTAMKKYLSLLPCLLVALISVEASAQVPSLPEGAESEWVMEDLEALGLYVSSDRATVTERIPDSLRLLTVGEAASESAVAKKQLEQNPNQRDWAAGILEFLRPKTFAIDGRALNLSEQEAVATWYVLTLPGDNNPQGSTRVMLEFWVPDSSYAAYMREKGYHATYGEVRLRRRPDSTWVGTIDTDRVQAEASCLPSNEAQEKGPGRERYYPPAQSEVKNTLEVAVPEYSSKSCAESRWLTLTGDHPLSKATMVGGALPRVQRVQSGSYPQ
jgi:hypothetical protein